MANLTQPLREEHQELLPHIDRHYLSDPARRAIMGPGSAGVAAVLSLLERPDVFKMAATQSFYPIDAAQERLPGLIAGANPKPEMLYVVYSRHDYDMGDGRTAGAPAAPLPQGAGAHRRIAYRTHAGHFA